MIKAKMIRLGLLGLVLAMLAPVAASSVVLTGDVDARIRNVDVSPTLGNGNEVYLNGTFRTNTILEFDLSFVQPGQTFDSILLRVTGIAAANTLFVNGYAGNGVLDVADGLESDNSLGTFAIAVGNNGPFALSTGYVNSLLGGGANYLGLNIGVLNSQTNSGFSDFSVEFIASSTPVAVPATWALLMLGFAGAGLQRRKK